MVIFKDDEASRFSQTVDLAAPPNAVIPRSTTGIRCASTVPVAFAEGVNDNDTAKSGKLVLV
jgi:hypothetical protein